MGLEQVARLLRELHDATAGFVPPEGVQWPTRFDGEEPATAVCHNDSHPATRCSATDDRWRSSTGTWRVPRPPGISRTRRGRLSRSLDEGGCRGRLGRAARSPRATAAPGGRLRRVPDRARRARRAGRASDARQRAGHRAAGGGGAPAFRERLSAGVPVAIRGEAAWIARNRTLLKAAQSTRGGHRSCARTTSGALASAGA